MHFRGINKNVFQFLQGLELDNSKTYWNEHQATWQGVVRPTMQALIEELEPFFGKIRMYRPNRDVRFSHDKTPYKTWVGITTQGTGLGGIGLFFAIEPRGIRFSAGAGAFASDQVKEYRRALDNPVAGNEFERITNTIRTLGYDVSSGRAPQLKRMPRGYDSSHPRAKFLKWRGVVARERIQLTDWIYTAALVDKVIETWSHGLPLVEWIQTNVGPTEMKRR